MEMCAQCGGRAERYPVVVIQALDITVTSVLDMSDNGERGKWMARAVCSPCHKEPKLKGHFFYRTDNWRRALESAGSSNLG